MITGINRSRKRLSKFESSESALAWIVCAWYFSFWEPKHIYLGLNLVDMFFSVACNISSDADRQGCCNIQNRMLLEEHRRQADQDRYHCNHSCFQGRMQPFCMQWRRENRQCTDCMFWGKNIGIGIDQIYESHNICQEIIPGKCCWP